MGKGKIGLGLFGGVFVLMAVGACGRDAPAPEEFAPLVAFDTTAVRIETAADTFQLTAEIAETNDQRAYGLMERASLPEEHGMLFLYPELQGGDAGFWMYRTLIPLDIAFLDAEGRIIALRAMEPCGSPYPRVCRIYSPGVPYLSALEVGRGYFERRGIGVGDRVVWQ